MIYSQVAKVNLSIEQLLFIMVPKYYVKYVISTFVHASYQPCEVSVVSQLSLIMLFISCVTFVQLHDYLSTYQERKGERGRAWSVIMQMRRRGDHQCIPGHHEVGPNHGVVCTVPSFWTACTVLYPIPRFCTPLVPGSSWRCCCTSFDPSLLFQVYSTYNAFLYPLKRIPYLPLFLSCMHPSKIQLPTNAICPSVQHGTSAVHPGPPQPRRHGTLVTGPRYTTPRYRLHLTYNLEGEGRAEQIEMDVWINSFALLREGREGREGGRRSRRRRK